MPRNKPTEADKRLKDMAELYQLSKRSYKDPLNDDFDGILAELLTWYMLGDAKQKELLITSLRDCSDLIDEDMPVIE